MESYTIYSQTLNDMSADYGMPPQFVGEAQCREEAAKIMRSEVLQDNSLAIWATDESGRKYYLDMERGLVN